MRLSIVFVVLFIGLSFCRNGETKQSEDSVEDLLEVPIGFPQPKFPKGNEFTVERWKLGKKLFYEKALSINNSISCGSCHQANLAFSDSVAMSPGVFDRPGKRNAPSLANVAYHPYFLREGSVPTLEMQILVPIQEHNEFNHNIVDIANVLKEDSIYRKMSFAAYKREMDPFVITRAISTFQRSILSGNSNYDKFKFQGNASALNEKEKWGMNLFFSEKTNCSSCHSGFNFSNYQFENTGLYKEYQDPGRFRSSNDSADLALFKVPSLRNLGYTSPYMHDGRLNTLEKVIDHYNSGGAEHINQNKLIRPLNLNSEEKEALKAFLLSLNDKAFVQENKWKE